MILRALAVLVVLLLLAPFSGAGAQTPGTLDPRPLPPLANPADPTLAAKELFGRALAPAPLAARALGSYARGCLAGAVALPVDGPAWQVMRVSRGRNFGHPALVSFLERFAERAVAVTGWAGLLVGDISQPRGGPMMWGHASHQIGLDADVWLMPMPAGGVDRAARETMMAQSVVAASGTDVDPRVWTQAHVRLLELASRAGEVERIFVNPAIKRALCRDVRGDRTWLGKIRPMGGHDYHFHIRLACPPGESGCEPQTPVPPGEGCDATLDWWFSREARTPSRPSAPPRETTLADLPEACRRVLVAQ